MLDLTDARILISNDDGIDAPGIKLLEQLAREFSDDVWVIAPSMEQSGAGHSLTLRRPLRIHERDERHFAVDGTPTDCILLGLQQVMRDIPPDIVLSGINRGSNLGEDVTYSGTVAAAMEATPAEHTSRGLLAVFLRRYDRLDNCREVPQGYFSDLGLHDMACRCPDQRQLSRS